MDETRISEQEEVRGNEDSGESSGLNINSKDYYVYEYHIKESNEVFYVGKGKGGRAWKDLRNPECERIKSEYDWYIHTVEDGLTEEEALKLERELISDYRSNGVMLTNIMPGSSLATEKEKIGYVKYLVFLIDKEVISLSLAGISSLLSLSQSIVWAIANTDQYEHVDPLLPDNINKIIHTYHINSYNEKQIKIGNIKYVLDLMDRDVLRLSQANLAEYYEVSASDVSASDVSAIKKGHTHKNVPSLIPEDIGNIFYEYDVFYISEKEKQRGMVVFILRLREEGIIAIMNKGIAAILDVNPSLVTEFTRKNEERKYTAKEYRPNEEIMAKLAPYFIIK